MPSGYEKINDTHECKTFFIKNARCFTCLQPGHRTYKYRSKSQCSICKRKHHCAICPTFVPLKESQPKPTTPTVLDPTASSWVGNTGSEGRVALQTALAVVDGKRENRVRVLFDTGS